MCECMLKNCMDRWNRPSLFANFFLLAGFLSFFFYFFHKSIERVWKTLRNATHSHHIRCKIKWDLSIKRDFVLAASRCNYIKSIANVCLDELKHHMHVCVVCSVQCALAYGWYVPWTTHCFCIHRFCVMTISFSSHRISYFFRINVVITTLAVNMGLAWLALAWPGLVWPEQNKWAEKKK